MTKTLLSVATHDQLPEQTSVVIIGAGIVGIAAALTLAERNIPVVVLEKGRVAAEQSSRNLGWIRKTNRHANDVPLAQAADRLWQEMPERINRSVGYRQSGIVFAARNEQQLSLYEGWFESVRSLGLDSQLLTDKLLGKVAPNCSENWLGGVYTPSDGCAEPAIATSAMAISAMEKGAIIIENCAVRTLATSAGKVSGVVTERGEIRCDEVLLAAGAWSRRFLANQGVSLPTLPMICSVLRTKPMSGPTDTAFAAPDFSFRRHADGGFIVTQRGALDAPLTLDHLLIGLRYLEQLRTQRSYMRISLGRHFFADLSLSRRWKASSVSPFERVRTLNPAANHGLNQEALTNLTKAWPMFANAAIDESWAGLIDVTPDSTPVIDRIGKIPGLTIATGFSGHGFGTGPAAGQLAADLVSNSNPLVDPSPYRFDRL